MSNALTATGIGVAGPDDNQAQAGHYVTYPVDTSYAVDAREAKGASQREYQTTLAWSSSTHGVRRLTPRECERLMGWPDDHTRWTAEGTAIADTHRYRMCGNGVVAPVAEWLGRRLMATVQA